MLLFTHNMSHSLAHMRRNDAVHAHVGDSCMSMHIVEESPAFSLHTSLPVSYGTPEGTNDMMPTGGSSVDTPLLPSMKQKDLIQNSGSVIEFCFGSLDLQRWLADYNLQNYYKKYIINTTLQLVAVMHQLVVFQLSVKRKKKRQQKKKLPPLRQHGRPQ